MEESLRKVKTLGQADDDVDDLAKWVTKSRTREGEDKELAREEALAAERSQAEQVCLFSLRSILSMPSQCRLQAYHLQNVLHACTTLHIGTSVFGKGQNKVQLACTSAFRQARAANPVLLAQPHQKGPHSLRIASSCTMYSKPQTVNICTIVLHDNHSC